MHEQQADGAVVLVLFTQARRIKIKLIFFSKFEMGHYEDTLLLLTLIYLLEKDLWKHLLQVNGKVEA